MRARWPFVLVLTCATSAACGSFSAAEAPAPSAEAGADASSDTNVPDGAAPDGGREEPDAGPDAAPLPSCLPGRLLFAEPFASASWLSSWTVSYPGAPLGFTTGTHSLVAPTGPTSPPYALRLQRTGKDGIAVSRTVDTDVATTFEVRFMARLDAGPLVFFQINDDQHGYLLKGTTGGGNLYLESPGQFSQVPAPTGWALFTVTIDKNLSTATMRIGSDINGAVLKTAATITPKLEIMLLGLIDPLQNPTSPTPRVDFDDVVACAK
jgi:hypothetical protein